MKLHKKYFLPFGFLFFFLVGIAFASSSQYLSQAQKFINANCSKKKITDETSVLCYLFAKTQEQDGVIAKINATISSVPQQITTVQNNQNQDEKLLSSLNQQLQTLSASVSSTPASPNWDIRGTYTLRLFPIYDSPKSRIITITTVDASTGQFSGTGSNGSDALTVNGIVNGSQFTLQTQTSGSVVDIQAQGSISPDGKLWGVGTGSDAHGFTMITLSGAATKK